MFDPLAGNLPARPRAPDIEATLEDLGGGAILPEPTLEGPRLGVEAVCPTWDVAVARIGIRNKIDAPFVGLLGMIEAADLCELLTDGRVGESSISSSSSTSGAEVAGKGVLNFGSGLGGGAIGPGLELEEFAVAPVVPNTSSSSSGMASPRSSSSSFGKS
jgi:hypothetical protein